MDQKHGGDIYRRTIELDYSVSINPFGMPERAREAAIEGVLKSDCYPDTACEALIRAISTHEAVRPEQVIPGNGAAELIYALTTALHPEQVLLVSPGFYEYERAAAGIGSTIEKIELREEESFHLSADEVIEKGKQTDLLWLCNPNNPTAYLIDELPRIIQELKDGPVIAVDECFLPFLEHEEVYTVKYLIDRYPKLVILRALTKFYGMPGLRIGYLLSADPSLREAVQDLIQPWNVSVPAQMAGAEAFSDIEYEVKTRQLIKAERAYLLTELQNGLAEKIYGSGSNYIFFKAEADLSEKLLEKGILIRSFEDVPALGKGYFRIGIRTHEENERLIDRWREAVGKR